MAHIKPGEVLKLNKTIRAMIQELNKAAEYDESEEMEFEIYKEPPLRLSIDLMDRETLIMFCKYLMKERE